ncbi:hypothetical protein K469DRAFT_687145 [Zopfia rhizophila CBS 207.26]|uniref:Uncharacterized protein n=1 Tax=Zopfia rhizophila CBS 207.26 TaxID=1314779 RepID=A0A6A6D599_9PEZI|nr:hypothetical protein K469DRAFT_687145 [Zopfia rhizophila CBS 207.26]
MTSYGGTVKRAWKGKDHAPIVAITLIQLASPSQWIHYIFEAQESALSCPISQVVEGAGYKGTPYLSKQYYSNHSFPKILLAALLTFLKMSNSEATVKDPTLYQDMGILLLAKPDSSNEAVATTEQLAPERKSYLGSGEMNTEVKRIKHSPREIKKPSLYNLLRAMERMSTLATQLSYKLTQQDTRISGCEKNDRYIISYLGEIDDQLDSLGSGLKETKDII